MLRDSGRGHATGSVGCVSSCGGAVGMCCSKRCSRQCKGIDCCSAKRMPRWLQHAMVCCETGGGLVGEARLVEGQRFRQHLLHVLLSRHIMTSACMHTGN
jgi:hypothetical protein